MAYSIHRTARFNKQLEGAVEYILNILCSPGAAKSLLDEYEQALQLIRNTPTWLPVDHTASAHFDTTIYRKTVRSYLIRYWVDKASSTVHLISFRHRSQDYTSFVDYDRTDES